MLVPRSSRLYSPPDQRHHLGDASDRRVASDRLEPAQGACSGSPPLRVSGTLQYLHLV